ncbi:hypothetical protein I5F12_09650 [Proteus cibarius]|uniref:Lipoprotein n=1 Tax=Proteus terrae subsp. cibarius TaxID=626774 RepID=A0A8I0WPU3_9GAMM|nr:MULTISPECIES: hypothetical protein [Proteus]QHP76081.1 hypothetical protein EKQ45_08985 [Proteus vulgaris]MBG2912777.1 hypothetical protein [Proteus terrae subsp. cibarius]MBG3091897.1 hypothetical protein [Proteus terrae subsp. cibarius]MBG6038334.1 hypothetical protein [Proteus terrae subsp. cibarius]MCM2365755.1 hypothetical protein [Proteus sp. FZP2095]
MNKLASVLTALVMATALVGCSDEKDTEISTTKTTTTENTIQDSVISDKKEDNTSLFKKNFVSSCILGSGITDDALIPQIAEVCECTYDNIIKNYGITEFIRVDMEMRKNGSKSLPKEWDIDKIVEQCMTKVEG